MLPAIARIVCAGHATRSTAAVSAVSQLFCSKNVYSTVYARFLSLNHGPSDEVSPDRAYNESRLCPPIRPETFDVLEQRLRNFFDRTDIDGWDIRRGLTELNLNDLTPEPETVIAALKAIRRVDDHSLAVRFLESLKDQSQMVKEVYPWLMEQIQPTLDELGISTPEELGYDKPELACPDPEDCDAYPYKRAGPTNAELWTDIVARGGAGHGGHH